MSHMTSTTLFVNDWAYEDLRHLSPLDRGKTIAKKFVGVKKLDVNKFVGRSRHLIAEHVMIKINFSQEQKIAVDMFLMNASVAAGHRVCLAEAIRAVF